MRVVGSMLLPTNFDMCGRSLGRPVKEIPANIKAGTATRLWQYAVTRLRNSGFLIPVEWDVEVEALEYPGDKPSEWTYHVTFTNPQGGQIGVQGIFLSRHGWPDMDHGLFIEA